MIGGDADESLHNILGSAEGVDGAQWLTAAPSQRTPNATVMRGFGQSCAAKSQLTGRKKQKCILLQAVLLLANSVSALEAPDFITRACSRGKLKAARRCSPPLHAALRTIVYASCDCALVRTLDVMNVGEGSGIQGGTFQCTPKPECSEVKTFR